LSAYSNKNVILQNEYNPFAEFTDIYFNNTKIMNVNV